MALRRSRLQFGLSALLLAAVVVALVMGYLTWVSVTMWDGQFELTMALVSKSGREIDQVSYLGASRQDFAEWLATDPATEHATEFRQATARNRDYVAVLWCSGKANFFGSDLSYIEPRYVVLRVTYADGAVIRRIVEVPAGRGPRSVVVPVP